MNYLSVCSGIEAASVAWHGLGWNPIGFSEIEPFPSAVLASRFPSVKNYGDMTKFKEWSIDGKIDLLVGGTPCQSFSVAGMRRGLSDPRGNLMLTFGALAAHFRPRWIVWENVPGVLSSDKGRDFGSFLGMLEELGYGFAYRVLDAQFFGVPQRRRRVFVVGCLGNWERPGAVLFDRESLSGNPPPSRERGKSIAFNAQGSASQGLSAGGVCPTLDGSKVPGLVIPLDMRNSTRRPENKSSGVGIGAGGDPAETLTASHVHAVCYENHAQDSRIKDCGGIAPTLYAKAGTGGGNVPLVLATGQANAEISRGVCGTLSGIHESPILCGHAVLRRLTPLECERLQGFPDNWTQIPWRGKPAEYCPDGPRYKACGNSMAVPVMRWIGERIEKVDSFRRD